MAADLSESKVSSRSGEERWIVILPVLIHFWREINKIINDREIEFNNTSCFTKHLDI